MGAGARVNNPGGGGGGGTGPDGVVTLENALINDPSTQVGISMPGESTLLMDDFGMFQTSDFFDLGSGIETSARGLRLRQQTSATLINTDAYISNPTNTRPWARRDQRQVDYVARAEFDNLADVRIVFGLVENAGGTYGADYLSTDDAAADYALIQYSTGRADAEFQTATRDGAAGNQRLTPMGAAPAVNTPYYFGVRMTLASNNVLLYILDSARALIASATHTLNLPIATTPLYAGIGVRTVLANNLVNMRGYGTRGTISM